MRVIFDTGSDYLAITSSLCSSKEFGAQFKNSIKKDMKGEEAMEFTGVTKDSSNQDDKEYISMSQKFTIENSHLV